MSWSISQEFTRYELMSGTDPRDVLVRKFFERGEYADGTRHPSTVEVAADHGTPFETFMQVTCAVNAAVGLVGALGSNWEQIHITLSGHANPGHQAVQGYAADGIHVSVSVSKYMQPDDDEANGQTQLQLAGSDG